MLNRSLIEMGFPKNHNIHTAPLIRRECEYKSLSSKERRALFDRIVIFTRHADFSWHTVYVEKKQTNNAEKLAIKLRAEIAKLVNKNLTFLLGFDCVKIYYDNGQTEVTKLLKTIFENNLSNVKWRKAEPSKYKMSQVADLACTTQLLELKDKTSSLSKSEKVFFGTRRNLKKKYLIPMAKKRI